MWLNSAYDTHETQDRSILLQAYFEMGIRFIERIVESLPAKFPVFLLLDFEVINDSALKAFLLNRERLGRVLFAPKNTQLHYHGLSFEEKVQVPFAFFGTNIQVFEQEREKTYGILLPALEKKNLLAYKEIGEAIDFFLSRGFHFRMIPEVLFVSEWDAIDLLFIPQDLSKEALRMVKGYLASQGELVCLGEIPAIESGMKFSEWKQK